MVSLAKPVSPEARTHDERAHGSSSTAPYVDPSKMLEYQVTRDRAALDAFCRQFKEPLFHFVKNFYCRGDGNRADDVVQEVFTRLTTTQMAFRSGNAWGVIATIARNAHIDMLRAEKRRPAESLDNPINGDWQSDSGAFASLMASTKDDPTAPAERKELKEVLVAALTRMPDDQARMIRMSLSEMTYDEMSLHCASMEGRPVPIGTIKSRLHAARAALAKILEAEN